MYSGINFPSIRLLVISAFSGEHERSKGPSKKDISAKFNGTKMSQLGEEIQPVLGEAVPPPQPD